jgi:(R,R)-butanediol dehydrogenase / meso-butanediol dehydrogenase / diacetyl reductase
MKAARFHGPSDIRIDEVPDPTVGPGKVEIAVDWCGICGTDLHEFLEGPIFIPAAGAPKEENVKILVSPKDVIG